MTGSTQGDEAAGAQGDGRNPASLWDFALRLYGSDGVSEACLHLQDTHEADVTLLLFAAWTGTERRWALTQADAEKAAGSVAAWHQEIVRPLRAVRRRMKQGPSPAPGAETEAVRERLKSVELGAEKIELSVLENLATPQAGSDASDIPATIRANLELVLGRMAGADLPEASQRALDRIIRAAESLAAPDA